MVSGEFPWKGALGGTAEKACSRMATLHTPPWVGHTQKGLWWRPPGPGLFLCREVFLGVLQSWGSTLNCGETIPASYCCSSLILAEIFFFMRQITKNLISSRAVFSGGSRAQWWSTWFAFRRFRVQFLIYPLKKKRIGLQVVVNICLGSWRVAACQSWQYFAKCIISRTLI